MSYSFALARIGLPPHPPANSLQSARSLNCLLLIYRKRTSGHPTRQCQKFAPNRQPVSQLAPYLRPAPRTGWRRMLRTGLYNLVSLCARR